MSEVWVDFRGLNKPGFTSLYFPVKVAKQANRLWCGALMANEQTNGADPQTAPAPVSKPKQTKKITTQGRKAKHRSTKAELDRERMTAKVITCLCAGKTIEETAKELDISEKWVVRVRAELSPDFVAYFGQAKSNNISALIEQMLEAQLKAMIKMVEVTDDELWLKAQRAPELATFFGVVNDKAVRILAAIERADERARLEREHLLLSGTTIPEGQTIRRESQSAAQGA